MSQNYFSEDIYKYDNNRKELSEYLADNNGSSDLLFARILNDGMTNIFSRRFGHQITEYANKIFLIGGTEVKKQNTGATFFDVKNDIWWSEDGYKWKEIEVDNNWIIYDYYQNLTTEINVKQFQFPKLTNFQAIGTSNGIYIIGGIIKDTWDGIVPNRKNKYIFDSDSPIMENKTITSNINKLIIKLELNGNKLKPTIIITNFTSITNVTNHKCIEFNGSVYLFDYNSVWCSKDYIYWYNLIPIRTNSAYNQFSYRRDYSVVAFNNKLYVLGGNTGNTVLNDIWESYDGISWKQIIEEADWEPRCSFCCNIFKTGVTSKNEGKQHIMLSCGRNYQKIDNEMVPMTYGDIWFTDDMINWTKSDANVLNRSDAAVSSFGTRTIIIGGRYDSMLEYCSSTWAVDAYNDIFCYGETPIEDLFRIAPVVGSVLVGGILVGETICNWKQYQQKYKRFIRDGSGTREWIESPNRPDLKVNMGNINYRPNETANGEFDENNINERSIVTKL